MKICYIDESGCLGRLTNHQIQPVFLLVGVIIEPNDLESITREFLNLKQSFYITTATQKLDVVLDEIKGSNIRKDFCKASKRPSRQAKGFLDRFVDILEKYGVQIIGRLWIKAFNGDFKSQSIYTVSIQRTLHTFQKYLEESNDNGIVVADSRRKLENTNVAHSIFTQKFRSDGDPYNRILEMPVFGHSDNHVGIQIADLICSALLMPMAITSYCDGTVSNIHIKPKYADLKRRYGKRIKKLQWRYIDNDRYIGGITVTDCAHQRSRAMLFK